MSSATLPSVILPSPSQFPAYVRAVNAIPMLSEERERELVQAWSLHQDAQAAKELVLSHLRLVVKVVKDHRGYGMSEGDLAQEGTVGLMKAVHRFRPEVNVRLAAYALHWIEAEVREFIFRNFKQVRLSTSKAMKKLFFAYRQTVVRLKHWGTEREEELHPAEVAQALGVSEEEVEEAARYFAYGEEQLSWVDDDQEEYEVQSLALSVDSHADGWDEEERTHLHRLVHQGLEALPERERQVLLARRLSEEPMGLVELGQTMNISAERVRQLENQALKRLGTWMGPHKLKLGWDG